MNVLDPGTIHECTSCQICAAICAHDAISIYLNENGFYRPVIDSNLCKRCGLCTRVCYKFDDSLSVTTIEGLNLTQLYSAWANDDDIVRETTSGGIGDILAHKLLEQGYKVVGCIYNEEKVRAEHHIATSVEDLVQFRGSKYIQSYTFEALKEVVRHCRQEKYAVFGTPCQIYALSKMSEIKNVRDHFVFIDLYCHGCPSLFAWTKYQSYLKCKLDVDSFDRVEFRSKIKGWGGFVVSVYGQGKRLFSSSLNLKGFYDLFFSDQILNDGCNDCILRSTLEYTDIRLGDFWGKKYLDNTRGVSGVSVVTERGKKVFDSIVGQGVTVKLCSYDDFLPYQSYGKIHRPNPASRKAILECLRNPNENVKDACHEVYRSQSFADRLKRYVKTLLALFPISVTNCIKKIL